MRHGFTLPFATGFGAVIFMATLSCAPPVEEEVAPLTEEDLTADEETALATATLTVKWFPAPAAIANAIQASESSNAKPRTSPVLVAGCPTLTLSPADGGAVNVAVDFAEGCPVPGLSDVTCSGTADGVVDFDVKNLTINFHTLSCADLSALEGNIDVDYAISGSVITFTGSWDLSAEVNGEQNRIVATGAVSFDTSDNTITIIEMNGQLSRGGTITNITMDSVQISPVDNPSLTPSSGTIQLNGGGLRRLIVRFNEDSPATGIVDVSILGLVFFPVELSSLG